MDGSGLMVGTLEDGVSENVIDQYYSMNKEWEKNVKYINKQHHIHCHDEMMKKTHYAFIQILERKKKQTIFVEYRMYMCITNTHERYSNGKRVQNIAKNRFFFNLNSPFG